MSNNNIKKNNKKRDRPAPKNVEQKVRKTCINFSDKKSWHKLLSADVNLRCMNGDILYANLCQLSHIKYFKEISESKKSEVVDIDFRDIHKHSVLFFLFHCYNLDIVKNLDIFKSLTVLESYMKLLNKISYFEGLSVVVSAIKKIEIIDFKVLKVLRTYSDLGKNPLFQLKKTLEICFLEKVIELQWKILHWDEFSKFTDLKIAKLFLATFHDKLLNFNCMLVLLMMKEIAVIKLFKFLNFSSFTPQEILFFMNKANMKIRPDLCAELLQVLEDKLTNDSHQEYSFNRSSSLGKSLDLGFQESNGNNNQGFNNNNQESNSNNNQGFEFNNNQGFEFNNNNQEFNNNNQGFEFNNNQEFNNNNQEFNNNNQEFNNNNQEFNNNKGLICEFWLRKNCTKGKNCPYIHFAYRKWSNQN